MINVKTLRLKRHPRHVLSDNDDDIKTIYALHSKTPEIGSAIIEPKDAKAESKRLAEFRKKLRETSPIGDLGDQPLTPPTVKEDPLQPWPDNKNPHTGEQNGPRGPEPTRYGDWERKGRVSDF
ncbi:hypothetical protein O0L34_g1315 [Tuta absoluta]|nr:hypothetical protein O0L34_g1315 [Tuta absoluta]